MYLDNIKNLDVCNLSLFEKFKLLLFRKRRGTPGWLSWLSICLLISCQVMILGSGDRALPDPLHGAWRLLEISLFPSVPLPHSLSLSFCFCVSLKYILKIKKNKIKNVYSELRTHTSFINVIPFCLTI